MKIAVFADIHSNLEALLAFTEISAMEDIEKYIFLGDIVGYGPNPNECLDEIQKLVNLEMVLGNHDSAAIWTNSPYSMNAHAQEAIFWTMEQLRPENITFLKSLKTKLVIDNVCYCHSTPQNPDSWKYVHSPSQAFWAFLKAKYPLSFISHTHWPRLISQGRFWKINIEEAPSGKKFFLKATERYLINCGSIGQPRDGNTAGCYCLYDNAEQSVIFHRFQYDKEKTAAKIKKAKLPDILALRLMRGQ